MIRAAWRRLREGDPVVRQRFKQSHRDNHTAQEQSPSSLQKGPIVEFLSERPQLDQSDAEDAPKMSQSDSGLLLLEDLA